MFANRELPPDRHTEKPTVAPEEWHECNYSHYYQSFADRANAQSVRHESKRTMKGKEATSNKSQADSTQKLGESLKDIIFWKTELQKKIQGVIDETDLLLQQKKRLENAVFATETPLHINGDNQQCRQRRQEADCVQDDADLNLQKEDEVITNVRNLLEQTIKEAEAQIRVNRDRKHELEMDWSDKKETEDIEAFCSSLKNQHTCKQFHAGAAKVPHSQSTPASRAQFTHDNMTRAEQACTSSVQLRTMIDNVLQDTSRDMIAQASQVDSSLQRRVLELADAKYHLEENLKKVCGEISNMENNIKGLKKAIMDMEDPMKVVQTRLHQREDRPNVECCRDPAQYSLLSEMHEIEKSVDALIQDLKQSENALQDLQKNRMSLEKEISVKTNNLFIDKEKCLTHRARYPSYDKLLGHQ